MISINHHDINNIKEVFNLIFRLKTICKNNTSKMDLNFVFLQEMLWCTGFPVGKK